MNHSGQDALSLASYISNGVLGFVSEYDLAPLFRRIQIQATRRIRRHVSRFSLMMVLIKMQLARRHDPQAAAAWTAPKAEENSKSWLWGQVCVCIASTSGEVLAQTLSGLKM